MPPRQGHCRIGTSGYQYEHWRGEFFPEGLSKSQWLHYYAGRFDTVELNNTFYRLPEASTFDRWRHVVDENFCFALKFSRYGSHLKRLKDPQATIAAFAKRARRLGATLGPILVQLPPRWSPDVERLSQFLAAAPRDLRWAVEFRDVQWLRQDVYAVLRHHEAALCIHDLVDHHPREVTASWVYLRFHGDHYGGSYSAQFLAAEARRIASYRARGLDVYAYFNNDLGGHAVRNAVALRRYVKNASA